MSSVLKLVERYIVTLLSMAAIFIFLLSAFPSEATDKENCLMCHKHLIRLETAGAKSSPLIVETGTPGFEIIGKVTSVIREL